MTKAASIIDITANSTVSEALAIQSSLTALSAEAKAIRGHRDDAEFRQYLLTALGAAEMGIKPNSKGSTALREAFVGAGRSKRNSETIVQATLNKKVATLARQALDTQNPLDVLRSVLADYEVNSVSSLKRWLAPAKSAVDTLMERVSNLDGDDAEMFEAAIVEWLAKREAKRDEASDEADAA